MCAPGGNQSAEEQEEEKEQRGAGKRVCNSTPEQVAARRDEGWG